MTIVAQDMSAKLLSLDTVREAFAAADSDRSVAFPVGDTVHFTLDEDWNKGPVPPGDTDKVNAFLSIGGGGDSFSEEFQLTKEALLEAASHCRLPAGLVEDSPAELIEPQLNYWFNKGLVGKEYQALITNSNVAAGVTRATIQPFSNQRLLEQMLDGIEARYGTGEVMADYKFTHSLKSTRLRLIVPEQSRRMQDTGTPDDMWSVGIQLQNSLVGLGPTAIDGYLFRWVCTNGMTDVHASSGKYSRRGAAGRNDGVYDWAREAVDDILGGLESSLDRVQSLTSMPVEGNIVAVLRSVFNHYKVPAKLQASVLDGLVGIDDWTMYDVTNAITQAANNPDLDPLHAARLMSTAGNLMHNTALCVSCSQLIPS